MNGTGRQTAGRIRAAALLLCALPLFAPGAAAQRRERAGFSYTHEDRAGLSGGGELTLRETEFRSGYPVWRGAGRTLVPGVRWTQYEFDAPAGTAGDTTVYSLRFPIRFAQSSSNGWSGFLLLTPALRTDFESVTGDDLGFNGLAIATRPLNARWSLSGGIVLGQDFGRTRIFPALGATWRPDDAWTVELLFPRPLVRRRAGDRFAWSLSIEPGGDQWNVERPEGNRDLALSEYRAGLGVEWRARPRLLVFAQAGFVFNRELELRDGRRKESDAEVDDTGFVRMGLAIE